MYAFNLERFASPYARKTWHERIKINDQPFRDGHLTNVREKRAEKLLPVAVVVEDEEAESEHSAVWIVKKGDNAQRVPNNKVNLNYFMHLFEIYTHKIVVIFYS